MYNYERGTKVYSNDGITRPTTWQGKIALMYPSDYGYASNTTVCLNSLSSCYNPTVKANNWLYSGSVEWLLSPVSSIADAAFNVYSSGGVSYVSVRSSWAVRPSLYLSLDILKVSGNGTSEQPYIIE